MTYSKSWLVEMEDRVEMVCIESALWVKVIVMPHNNNLAAIKQIWASKETVSATQKPIKGNLCHETKLILLWERTLVLDKAVVVLVATASHVSSQSTLMIIAWDREVSKMHRVIAAITTCRIVLATTDLL